MLRTTPRQPDAATVHMTETHKQVTMTTPSEFVGTGGGTISEGGGTISEGGTPRDSAGKTLHFIHLSVTTVKHAEERWQLL